MHFKIDNVETDITFADYSDRERRRRTTSASTLDATGKLDIAEHKLPLSYGKVLRLGLDEVIIPALDPNATNLNELLADLVNCQAVGQAINDALAQQFGFGGGAGTWQTACTAGLSFGAQTHLQQDRRHRLARRSSSASRARRRPSTRTTTARSTRSRPASGPAR